MNGKCTALTSTTSKMHGLLGMNQNNSRPLTNNAQRFECSRKTPRWAVLVPAYTASGIWVVLRLSITDLFPADRALAPSLLGTVLLSPGICTPSLTLARGASGSPSLPSSEDARSQHEGRPTESRQIMTHELLTTGFYVYLCVSL